MTGSHAPTNFIDPKLREKRVDYNQHIVIPQNKIMFNTNANDLQHTNFDTSS